ncbi:MAG: hypothetical protein M5U34_18980 [Chloroflexi bacterium]|nr:hypothetical protein [Chloroflexota bacterium]
MVEQEPAAGQGKAFWTAVSHAVDLTQYRPHRISAVDVARLETEGAVYYVLKQPQAKTYLRLSEPDYALWWQMDGSKASKTCSTIISNGTTPCPSVT